MAHVDVPIRRTGVVSDGFARVDDPIRSGGVVNCDELVRVDDPIRSGGVVGCYELACVDDLIRPGRVVRSTDQSCMVFGPSFPHKLGQFFFSSNKNLAKRKLSPSVKKRPY